jgi:hypothetical protein
MAGGHLGDDISRFVGYTSDKYLFSEYKVVIIPSGFFDDGVYGSNKTEPKIPPESIEGVPFLFGSPQIEMVGDVIVVHADLVASAYFLLGRYEEILHRDLRDEHGRFPGIKSVQSRAGFIDRPVVDEYGRLIRMWLNQSGVKTEESTPFIAKINLTHDVDAPFSGRTWRNVARKILSGQNPIKAVFDKYTALELDPYYTFPWLLQQNAILQRSMGEDKCRSLLFFRSGGNAKEDKPHYNLRGKDIQALYALCKQYGATVGLHCSYQAGRNPSLILQEKLRLENAFGIKVTDNRNHFLASREPEDVEALELAGITDDFTAGYADVAGFRLGTSKPVRYINPVSRRLSSLTLHPLIIMDGTLGDPKYMNLTYDEAEEYCLRLINNIRKFCGELTLLWHNTSAIEYSGYLRNLYSEILRKMNQEK